MPESVRVETDDAIITVTIDRPEAHNALNAEVLAGLGEAVRTAEVTPEVRAVIVTGAGEKAFSAGADLKDLAGMPSDRGHEVMRSGQQVMRSIERATIPVITAVNGLALGGGFELVLASAVPVLSRRAALGLPESGLGLIPGYGGTQRLPRVIGRAAAAHLMLTGSRLDADRAFALGLTPVAPVDPDALMDTARELAETIARQGPVAVRSIMTALAASRDTPIEDGLALETGLAALAIGGAESTEGIAAFQERRPPKFADRGEPQ